MPVVGRHTLRDGNNTEIRKLVIHLSQCANKITTVLTYRNHKIHLSQIDHTDTANLSHKRIHTSSMKLLMNLWESLEQVVATLPDWPSLNEILSPCLCTPGTVYGKHRGSIQSKCKMARVARSLAITKMLFIGIAGCLFIYLRVYIGVCHHSLQYNIWGALSHLSHIKSFTH